MIEFTFEHINTHSVDSAFHKVRNAGLKNPKVAYNVHKISTKVLKALDDRRKEYTKGLMEYAEKDENGKVQFEGMGPKIKKEFEKEVEALTQKVIEGSVEIEMLPINVMELAEAQLTPNDVAALAPMLTGLEDEKLSLVK